MDFKMAVVMKGLKEENRQGPAAFPVTCMIHFIH